MKHETQTTETFTRVSYTCDVCGNALLDGQKAEVCTICERDVCRAETCSILAYFDDANYAERLCSRCQMAEAESGGRARIEGTMRVAREHCDSIREAWRLRSLAHKEDA